MCVVSMIGDHYRDRWSPPPVFVPTVVPSPPVLPSPVSREEFDALKREVEEMKALLQRAVEYDKANGEPACEQEEKLEVLRRVAEIVGVDLDDVLGPARK